MRNLIALWRFCHALLHTAHTALRIGWRGWRLSEAERPAFVHWWATKLLRIFSVRCVVVPPAEQPPGQPPNPMLGPTPPAGVLLAANHVSWLDILAVFCAVPHARFVSKADVLGWPLLGRMMRAGGTLFLERERKRDAMCIMHAIGQALRDGQTVAVFPEGTTGCGAQVLPFHANLLQAPIAVAAPVQPVALCYFEAGQPFSRAVQFVGQTTLLQSLWRVARARSLRVEVRFLAPRASAQAERRALAAALQAVIQNELDAAAG